MELHGSNLESKFSWEEIYQKFIDRFPSMEGSPRFKQWFMNNVRNGWLFDRVLVARCYKIYDELVTKDTDHFMLIVGKEGSGKTTLAMQSAAWIDPDFNLDNVCFTPEHYVEMVKSAKKGSALVVDEGGVALYSRESLSAINIQITKLFMLQRQKNLVVIVNCPSYWDIDAYIRRHRISTLIRVIEQGKYCGYIQRAIDIINELSRKIPLTKIRFPNGSFWHGSFNKPFPRSIDREAYLKKKKEHLEEYMNSIDVQRWVPTSKLATALSLDTGQIDDRLRRGVINGKKIGNRWFITAEDYRKLITEGPNDQNP